MNHFDCPALVAAADPLRGKLSVWESGPSRCSGIASTRSGQR